MPDSGSCRDLIDCRGSRSMTRGTSSALRRSPTLTAWYPILPVAPRGNRLARVQVRRKRDGSSNARPDRATWEEIPIVRTSRRPEQGPVGTSLRFTPRGAASALTVQELAGPSTTRGLLETGGTWALLTVLIGAYIWHPRPLTYLAAFVLVASRQYALLILMHDAFHSLLHPHRRVNDVVGAWCIGAACGSSYWGSRGSHLEHHGNWVIRAIPSSFSIRQAHHELSAAWEPSSDISFG